MNSEPPASVLKFPVQWETMNQLRVALLRTLMQKFKAQSLVNVKPSQSAALYIPQ